jgi:hypothetical protein
MRKKPLRQIAIVRGPSSVATKGRAASTSSQALKPQSHHKEETTKGHGLLTTDHGPIHRNFSVVNAKSAKTKAAIQKRAMIFDSFQPPNSK